MLNVLLTTAMFVGGSVAFILDNTIPGKEINIINYFFTFLKTNIFNCRFMPNLKLKKQDVFLCSPGSPEERGLRKLKRGSGLSAAELEGMRSYDLPFGMDFLRRHHIFKYIPISPTFNGYQWGWLPKSSRNRRGPENVLKAEGGTVPGESRV